jgi:hypothetical protein
VCTQRGSSGTACFDDGGGPACHGEALRLIDLMRRRTGEVSSRSPIEPPGAWLVLYGDVEPKLRDPVHINL